MIAILALAALGCALAQPPDIGRIMYRVAANQAASQETRLLYVYNQKQLLRMIRSNGKLAREERREYVVAPGVHHVKKELATFTGKYEFKGALVPYDRPGYHYKGLDIDGDLIDDMSKDMTDDGNSRDGIARDMFPLTYHQQLRYYFRLVGVETYRGRAVYRVRFQPKPHLHCEDCDTIWKGDALIDAAEYQPVLVTTSMALKIPLVVKTMLGTDIKGLGFSVSYQKFEDGVWFPVSYGGEFAVKGLFFYKRTISVSLVNGDFHRADVQSNVAYKMEDR
ncbi:MAG: hypothetical protein LAP87_28585 [Acidobacteriia bacterium]|nr:hypothetical protein [Terriglobia bacterium]